MKIKVITILFFMAGFLTFKAFLLQQTGVEVDFPTYDSPTVDFVEVGDGCSGIGGCLGFIGKTLANIGLAVVWVVRNIIALAVFAAGIIIIMTQLSVTGFDGIDPKINALINFVMAAIIGLLVYSITRRGETNA